MQYLKNWQCISVFPVTVLYFLLCPVTLQVPALFVGPYWAFCFSLMLLLQCGTIIHFIGTKYSSTAYTYVGKHILYILFKSFVVY